MSDYLCYELFLSCACACLFAHVPPVKNATQIRRHGPVREIDSLVGLLIGEIGEEVGEDAPMAALESTGERLTADVELLAEVVGGDVTRHVEIPAFECEHEGLLLFGCDTDQRADTVGDVGIMEHATDVERDVASIAGVLERREFVLIQRTEPKEPRLAVGGGALFDQNVLVAQRGEKAVDLVGPLDFVEVTVDPPVEVIESRDGGVVTDALLERFGVALVFLPEVGDELVVDGDELGELDAGGGGGEDLAENELVGIDREAGDDAHWPGLRGRWGESVVSVVYFGLLSAAGYDTNMVVSVGSTVPHSRKQVTPQLNAYATISTTVSEPSAPRTVLTPDEGESFPLDVIPYLVIGSLPVKYLPNARTTWYGRERMSVGRSEVGVRIHVLCSGCHIL